MIKLQAEFTSYMKIALKNDSIDFFRSYNRKGNIDSISIYNIDESKVSTSQLSDVGAFSFEKMNLEDISDRRLFLAIKSLTKKQQEIFLSYVEGISLNEIALRYGMAFGSVKSSIFQIKSKLRKYMKEIKKMKDFENVLDKAQFGDRQAMELLILEYMPLIDGLVKTANRNIDKDEFKQYLLIKFVENTKKFKKINLD